jgi:Lon protease-like protein
MTDEAQHVTDLGEPVAMFPLGSVLLPGMALPLHVFEPRYRALADHVVRGEGNGEFGVVLIERGSEVGGGDVRSDLGVLARVVDATEFDDGRWSLVAVGTERIRVDRWLPDDPYPQARVTRLRDALNGPQAEAVDKLVSLLSELSSLSARLGHPGPEIAVDVEADPAAAVWQIVARSPLGAADRHRLLACDDPHERVASAAELMAEQRDLFTALLAQRGKG